MNIKTRAITESELKEIVNTLKEGFNVKNGKAVKPNSKVAMALILQANLGLRIGDVVSLRLCDIVMESGKWKLNIVEQKTKKVRCFSMPNELYTHILGYAIDHGVKGNQRLVELTARQLQRQLHTVVKYLELERVSTHSFRKFFAVSIYNENGFNVELVRHLLQHSSTVVTQRYLSVQPQLIELALNNHIKLPT